MPSGRTGSGPAELLADPSSWQLFPDRSDAYVEAEAVHAKELPKPSPVQWRYVRRGMAVALLTMFIAPKLFAGLFVLLLAWVLYDLRGTAKVQQRYAHEWARQRGLRHVDRNAAGDHASPLEPFAQVAELPQLARVKGWRGAPWGAAPDALLGFCRFGSSRNDRTSASVISIGLPSQVAERYPAVSIHLSGPGRILSAVAPRVASHWRALEFEQDHRLAGVRVRIGPGQDELATWELCHPGFLAVLSERGTALTPFGCGFLVAGGRVTAWRMTDPFARAIEMRALHARGRAGDEHVQRAEGLAVAWLQMVRDMHRRLIEEWR